MNKPIYLDYMATTPVDPRVKEKMMQCLDKDGIFGNSASSTHSYGYEAMQCVEKARGQIADFIHATPREIVFTSGATESDNLALQGAARFYARQGNHIITMLTEHKAVLDTCYYLSQHGFEVTYLDPEKNGRLDLEKLKQAFRPETILVSVMHVNNEIGVIQDIDSIGKVVKKKGAIFHVDAAQSAGKILIDLSCLPVDLMSFSGHKTYGPKGVGVLYVRRKPRVRLEPLIHGGGHEQGMRSGTLATHQIAGIGEAFEIARQDFDKDHQHILKLRNKLLEKLKVLDHLQINGDLAHCISGCLSLTFEGVDAETLLLSLRHLAVSTGSACSSANISPSHVLTAIGLTPQQIQSTIRLSIGRFTTEEEIEITGRCMVENVKKLRKGI